MYLLTPVSSSTKLPRTSALKMRTRRKSLPSRLRALTRPSKDYLLSLPVMPTRLHRITCQVAADVQLVNEHAIDSVEKEQQSQSYYVNASADGNRMTAAGGNVRDSVLGNFRSPSVTGEPTRVHKYSSSTQVGSSTVSPLYSHYNVCPEPSPVRLRTPQVQRRPLRDQER